MKNRNLILQVGNPDFIPVSRWLSKRGSSSASARSVPLNFGSAEIPYCWCPGPGSNRHSPTRTVLSPRVYQFHHPGTGRVVSDVCALLIENDLLRSLTRNVFADQWLLQFTNPNPDDEKARLSVEQCTRVRSRSVVRSRLETFCFLARNRFYTYELGYKHASKPSNESMLRTSGWVVTEPMASPGLEALRVQTEFRHSNPGKGVIS